MMHILELLFPYIVFFYMVDCFVRVKKFQIVFYSHFGRGFSLKKTGIRWIGVSPFCRFYRAGNFPFFMNEEGIYLWNKDGVSENDLYERKFFDRILFDEIKGVQCEGELVKINQKNICLGAPHTASWLAETIEMLRTSAPESRKAKYEKSFKKTRISPKILRQYHHLFWGVSFFGAVLFICFFICLPLFFYLDFPFRFDVLMFSILALYISILGVALYTHKKICKRGEQFYFFLFSLIFSPVSAIHALHMITKDAPLSHDWVEQAAYWLSPGDLKDILTKEMKRIHFSKEERENTDFMPFLDSKEQHYRFLMKGAGLSPDEVFAPPVKHDPSAYSYCPFCETDFVDGVDLCPDCSIRLVRYEAS